jgi:hypothetical protein
MSDLRTSVAQWQATSPAINALDRDLLHSYLGWIFDATAQYWSNNRDEVYVDEYGIFGTHSGFMLDSENHVHEMLQGGLHLILMKESYTLEAFWSHIIEWLEGDSRQEAFEDVQFYFVGDDDFVQIMEDIADPYDEWDEGVMRFEELAKALRIYLPKKGINIESCQESNEKVSLKDETR